MWILAYLSLFDSEVFTRFISLKIFPWLIDSKIQIAGGETKRVVEADKVDGICTSVER